jgi:hypothetical protein
MKVLLFHARMNRWPGMAVAGGVRIPAGIGPFTPLGSGEGFAYLALTEWIGEGERVLIHVNLGLSVHALPDGNQVAPTAGLGTQIRMVAGLHGVSEIVHNDAYAGATGGAVQVGFRYILGEHVQLDATFGIGTWGADPRPPWGSLGLRLVSHPLW